MSAGMAIDITSINSSCAPFILFTAPSADKTAKWWLFNGSNKAIFAGFSVSNRIFCSASAGVCACLSVVVWTYTITERTFGLYTQLQWSAPGLCFVVMVIIMFGRGLGI